MTSGGKDCGERRHGQRKVEKRDSNRGPYSDAGKWLKRNNINI